MTKTSKNKEKKKIKYSREYFQDMVEKSIKEEGYIPHILSSGGGYDQGTIYYDGVGVAKINKIKKTFYTKKTMSSLGYFTFEGYQKGRLPKKVELHGRGEENVEKLLNILKKDKKFLRKNKIKLEVILEP